ncbi:hypothetical protein BC834DRAFT_863074 [Gloeopeniophorella convolvens]|nr:hypothetical protein BC834DRAFT_863074 [Gloeopeniophorella convolvens]
MRPLRCPPMVCGMTMRTTSLPACSLRGPTPYGQAQSSRGSCPASGGMASVSGQSTACSWIRCTHGPRGPHGTREGGASSTRHALGRSGWRRGDVVC